MDRLASGVEAPPPITAFGTVGMPVRVAVEVDGVRADRTLRNSREASASPLPSPPWQTDSRAPVKDGLASNIPQDLKAGT